MAQKSAVSSSPGTSGNAPIRLGIVGANAERAWALNAHLPSIRRMPQDIVLTAVSARSFELAEAARAVFGAAQGFGDSLELVRSSSVDLVAVTVKVPEHRAIVLAALAAGKHVFCEWPLGRNLAEAEELAAAVPPGVHAVIGLQGLSAPAVLRAQELVAAGAIGRPTALRVFSPSISWGAEVPEFYAYLQDRRNGATLETVAGGHTLSLIEALAGAYVEVDARNSTLRPRVRISGTDEFVDRACADHMLVLGRHDNGCVSTLEIIGGIEGKPFELMLEGELGWIRLTGGERGRVPVDCQAGPLLLETSFAGWVPVEPLVSGLKGGAINVAESYARIVQDLRLGRRTLPDFDVAVRLTRLIEAIDRASLSGRQEV